MKKFIRWLPRIQKKVASDAPCFNTDNAASFFRGTTRQRSQPSKKTGHPVTSQKMSDSYPSVQENVGQCFACHRFSIIMSYNSQYLDPGLCLHCAKCSVLPMNYLRCGGERCQSCFALSPFPCYDYDAEKPGRCGSCGILAVIPQPLFVGYVRTGLKQQESFP